MPNASLDRLPPESRDTENQTPHRVHCAAILVVDDEPGIQNFLKRILSKHYALVETADSVETAEALRRRCHFDLLIVDIRLPGTSGMDWLVSLREQGVQTEVIFMTAFADLDTAISALRAGAADFLLKPFRAEQMLSAVQRCLERREALRENFLLRRQVAARHEGLEGIIGQSEPMKEVAAMVHRVARTASTVLIEGETGTGKELVARAVHDLSGRSGAFVAVNCGSISPELLESELFGHTKGAFTSAHAARDGLFAYAHRGTIFLDEIVEMPLAMQAKLLRVLEEKTIRPVGANRETPIDVRVVAACNRPLSGQVEAGTFREDLYYRLNVLRIGLAPLRERPEDIPTLAEFFSESLASELGLTPIPFAHGDLVRLQQYDWPGNVRELRNVIERSLLLGKLPQDCCREVHDSDSQTGAEAGFALSLTMEEVEKRHMLRVLESVEGNKSEAARRLGVSRKTLERKLHVWNGKLRGEAEEA